MDWIGTNGGAAMIGGGTALSVASNFEAARATEMMAQRRKAAADQLAGQLRVNAGQQVAASQAGAAEARRQGDIIQSNLIAAAAASGGGASDPTIETIAKRNAGETQYRSALAMYQGNEAARVLTDKANATQYGAALTNADAANAAAALRTKSIGTVLASGGAMMSKYWMPPKSAPIGAKGGFNLYNGSDVIDPNETDFG